MIRSMIQKFAGIIKSYSREVKSPFIPLYERGTGEGLRPIGTVPIDFLPLFKGEKSEGQKGL